ncbi:hypothetical protein RCC30_12730 [Pseudomonas fluorescens]|nr:hypothetical protein RCC30_12730 [Pseudomonas fluorescens]
MIDLHMSGDLSGGVWDRPEIFPDNVYSNIPSLHGGVTNYQREKRHDPSVASIHEEFPRLRRLRPNDEEFHRQLRLYLTNLNRSLTATVKLALSNMAHADLQAFLTGAVTFLPSATMRLKRLHFALPDLSLMKSIMKRGKARMPLLDASAC